MKRSKNKPYIAVFIAIAGVAAGIAADVEAYRLNDAFSALSELSGAALLSFGLLGVLLDTILYLFCGVFNSVGIQKLLAAICVWFKMYIMGCFIKGAFSALTLFPAIILTLLTAIGGGTICGALLVRPHEKQNENQRSTTSLRMYLFTAGIMAEGIIMPSVARILSLLVC